MLLMSSDCKDIKNSLKFQDNVKCTTLSSLSAYYNQDWYVMSDEFPLICTICGVINWKFQNAHTLCGARKSIKLWYTEVDLQENLFEWKNLF